LPQKKSKKVSVGAKRKTRVGLSTGTGRDEAREVKLSVKRRGRARWVLS